MSAIESAKLKLAYEEFDLRKSIEGISDIYYTQCQDKGVSFILTQNLSDFLLIGDALRVNQVLLNLVSNAYKFTPSGGKITVSAYEKKKVDDKVSVRFTVSDTGIGMSEEMMSRRFKPFEQESATTARKSGGSGLGMSIAKSLVELMGGSISAVSKKGQGTTFTVTIPFGLSERSAEEQPDKISDGSYDFTGHRLLLAEDNEINTEAATEILGLVNMKCDHAENGKIAVEMFEKSEKGTYDLILMDVQMPEMDGNEAAKTIRQSSHPQAKTIPIYAMTANAFTEDVAKSISCGMNGHLAKPIDTKKALFDYFRSNKKITYSVLEIQDGFFYTFKQIQ